MPQPTSKSRQELRSRFVRNAIPTETDFADLIAASLNQADDGLLKLPDQPLGLVRQKENQPVLRFFADPKAEGSVWQVQLGAGDKPGFGLAGADGKLALFVDGATGNVGIGIGAKRPEAALHVAGNLKVEAGSITLDRDQKVFFTDNGQIGSRDQYHQLLFRCTENITELREWGDLWFSAGANIENTNQPKMIVKHNGLVGIGTAMPFAKLQVTGNVSITSAEGQNFACKKNYMAPGSLTIGGIDRNYGGGTNWNDSSAGLLLETLDNTEIAIHDSGLRLASFMYYESANNRFTIGRDMGWGAISAVNIQGSLYVNGQTNILTGTNPIRFSSVWTQFPDDKTNGAEICNDTTSNKTLMIVGNKSNGPDRRVSVWDILEVNGTFRVQSSIGLGADGKFALFVDGATDNVRIGATASAAVSVTGNLQLKECLLIPKGKEIWFSDNGQIRSLDDKHRILFRRDESKMELREYGDIVFSSGSTQGQETSKMVIHGSGNVGIGTTKPDFELDVNGAVRLGGFTSEEKNEWPNIVWCRDLNKGWDEGLMKRGKSDGFFNRAGFGIHIHESRSFELISTGLRPLLGVEGGTGNTSIRGNLKVNGCITPSAGNSESTGILFPKDPGGGSGDAAWIRYYARSAESCTLEIGIANDNDDQLFLNATGGVRCSGNLTQLSDINVKTNISQLPNPLESLLKLNGISYAWKRSLSDEPTCLGLIAQEVAEVFPQLVESDHDGFLHLNYLGFIPILIESIKAQQKQLLQIQAALQ